MTPLDRDDQAFQPDNRAHVPDSVAFTGAAAAPTRGSDISSEQRASDDNDTDDRGGEGTDEQFAATTTTKSIGSTAPRANSAANILKTIADGLRDSDVVVDEVDAIETVLDPTKKPPKIDKLRAQLLAAGVAPEQLEQIVAIKLATKGGNPHLPLWATVTDLAMVTLHAKHTDAQLQENLIKAIRADGGPRGAVANYADILVKHGIPRDVADKSAAEIAAKVNARMTSVRASAVAMINEQRRRAAVAAGIDPKTVSYLRARV